jgi:hypothetical protein
MQVYVITVFTAIKGYNIFKKINIEKSNKTQQCIKIYYSIFI